MTFRTLTAEAHFPEQCEDGDNRVHDEEEDEEQLTVLIRFALIKPLVGAYLV